MKNTVIRHFGKIVNGKRIYDNPELHKEYITDLEGKEFEEVIKLKFKRVSIDAHGYYRAGIIKECTDYELFAGWEEEEIHKFFAGMFLSYKVVEKYLENGITKQKEKEIVTSTSALSTKEMFDYTDKVIRWLAQEGIVIHTPEQYIIGKYKTKQI
jgi:hypothetical protein